MKKFLKILGVLLACVAVHLVAREAFWDPTGPLLYFNDVTFVGSHHPEQTWKYGYNLTLQEGATYDQLMMGVRVLDLRPRWVDGKFLLTHGDPKAWYQNLLMRPGTKFTDLQTIFDEIYQFLSGSKMIISPWSPNVKNPQAPNAIITITLTGTGRPDELKKLLEQTGLAPFALPRITGSWPTLDFMIKNNKRLVIIAGDDLPITQDWSVLVNIPWNMKPLSSTSILQTGLGIEVSDFYDPKQQLRADNNLGLSASKFTAGAWDYITSGYINKLVIGDFLGGKRNSTTTSAFVKNIIDNGIVFPQGELRYKGSRPNQIIGDNVHKGDLFKLANELNRDAFAAAKRAQEPKPGEVGKLVLY